MSFFLASVFVKSSWNIHLWPRDQKKEKKKKNSLSLLVLIWVFVTVYAFGDVSCFSHKLGFFPHKGTEEIAIGVEDDCVGLCNGLWCLHMLNLPKAI